MQLIFPMALPWAIDYGLSGQKNNHLGQKNNHSGQKNNHSGQKNILSDQKTPLYIYFF
jgi:hypothetical protein